MQKVYLLLRNNQQTGPYSLEEIIQLKLKAFDLVWVDGRSAAWRYPGEIEALKPYVPEAPAQQFYAEPLATSALDEKAEQPETVIELPLPVSQPAPSTPSAARVFVSMPGRASNQPTARPSQPVPDIQKHESLRLYQPVAAAEEKQQLYEKAKPAEEQKLQGTLQTNYSRSLNDVEEEYSKWVYESKTKKKRSLSKKDISISVLVVTLIIAGYIIVSRPALIQPQVKKAGNDPAVITNVEEKTVPIVTVPVPQQVIHENDPVNENASVQKKSSKSSVPSTNNEDENTESPVNENPVVTTTSEEKETAGNDEEEVGQKEEQPKEKKKKLGEVLRGIFSKKEKEEADNPVGATDRQATKRGDETAEPVDRAALVSMIDITADAGDDWMMGINGTKVTLRNRNSVALQSTVVVVLYYDSHNQLIEKKNIQFSNIPPRGKMTMPAPDHKYADHIKLQLGTVIPKEDRYASQ